MVKTRLEHETEMMNDERLSELDIQENHTRVLVANRRCGKTRESIKIATEKLQEGKDVLFCTFNERNIKLFLLGEFVLNLTNNRIPFIVNKSNTTIIVNGSNVIKFTSDISLKNLKGTYYRIYDEFLIPTGFDFVTITGTRYEESLW